MQGVDGPAGDAGRVKSRVLALFSVVLVLVVAAFVVAAYVTREQSKRAEVERRAEMAQALLGQRFDKEAALMHATLDAIATDAALRRAVEGEDKPGLRQRVLPLFEQLRDEHGISHLYFSRANRSPLLKLEGKGRGGQVVDRVSLFEAAENGADSYGLDLGALGTLTLRAVAPLRDGQGQLLGFVELGEDVAPVVEAVHRILGVETLILVRKDLLDRDKWEEGERLTGRQGGWDQLSSSVAVAQTLQTIPMSLALLLEDGSNNHKAVIATEKGRRVYSLATRPLRDVGRQQIGEIVVLEDVTEADHSFYRGLIALALFAGLVGTLGFLRCRALLTPPAELPPAEPIKPIEPAEAP